jgi:hypothetical protein
MVDGELNESTGDAAGATVNAAADATGDATPAQSACDARPASPAPSEWPVKRNAKPGRAWVTWRTYFSADA